LHKQSSSNEKTKPKKRDVKAESKQKDKKNKHNDVSDVTSVSGGQAPKKRGRKREKDDTYF